MQQIKIQNKTFKQITYYKTGNGPVLFLVHGFPANVFLWRHLIADLSLQYTLILPNFFKNEGDWLNLDGSTNMNDLAKAFNDILVHESINKIVYAGHSMGGYMGLAFAEMFPEKLAGLSLIHSSALADDEARAEGRKKTVSIMENGGKNLFLKKMVPALFPQHFAHSHPEVIARQLEEALAVNTQSLVAFYRAIMERKGTSHVSFNASFPVQNIIGKLDSLANISKEIDAANLSFVNFVNIYPNEGHMAMLEAPEKVSKDILSFAKYCWTYTRK